MFERYTEKARRVIFFARYEASQFGSPYIETEHLLLGLLREDKALTNRFLRSHVSVDAIRKQVEAHTTIREKVSTSVDLPLSNECKQVLAYAAEEAERLGHKHIGTEHLLLGLLREETSFAAELLKERGVQLATVREELARTPNTPAAGSVANPAQFSAVSCDLTQAALDGNLDPVVGREQEINALIEVLCSRNRKNAVLIGERGVGKSAIVEGLAQRIAGGMVPPLLAEKRIQVFDPQRMTGWTARPQTPEEGTSSAAKPQEGSQKVEEMPNPPARQTAIGPEVILFVHDLKDILAASGMVVATRVVRPGIARGEIQCIATCTPSEYLTLISAAPSLGDWFRAIHVRPLDEEETLRVLQVRKNLYEKFHEVTYGNEALECAARCSNRFRPEEPLPGKALELLDAAGARVKLRQTPLPEEVAEVQKKIKFILHRMDSAVASHEFEKARFYSEEERKEKENLRILREKYHLDDPPSSSVSREDVEEVIKSWAEYPFRP